MENLWSELEVIMIVLKPLFEAPTQLKEPVKVLGLID